jgi:hypothetical protein
MSYHLGSVGPAQREELIAECRDDEPRPRSRKLLATAVALLVMALFAGGLWFAYTQGMRRTSGTGGGGDVPLIRADERPTKVKPDKPGGMEIPDRDKLIYTQKRAAVEHLLPPPEKPMPRPTPPPAPAAQPAAWPPPAAVAVSTTASVPAAPPDMSRSAQQQQAAAPSDKAPSTPPTPEKTAAASSPPAKPAGTRLQLGSVRSESAARQEWDRIKRAAPDLLGSLSATPVRADLGDKGVFYRILTGPVAEADRVCGELRRRDIGCIIAR